MHLKVNIAHISASFNELFQDVIFIFSWLVISGIARSLLEFIIFKVRKLLTHAMKGLKNRLSHNRPMIFPGIDSQSCSLQLLKFPIFWIFLDCKVCQEIFCYKCYKFNSYVKCNFSSSCFVQERVLSSYWCWVCIWF